MSVFLYDTLPSFCKFDTLFELCYSIAFVHSTLTATELICRK